VRGKGLMIAVDLTSNRQTRATFSSGEIYNFLVDAVLRGMFLSYSDWGLSLFPPLNSDEQIADEIVHPDETLHSGIKAGLGGRPVLKEFGKPGPDREPLIVRNNRDQRTHDMIILCPW
jgi:hypothetical protein